MNDMIFRKDGDENSEPMIAELAKVSSVRAEKVELTKEVPSVSSAEGEEETEEGGAEEEGQLAIDVYQTPDEIVIESTIAGAKKEDLDIFVASDSVTIKGKRERPNKVEDADYFYQECYWGKFSRSVILPQEIDPSKAASALKGGVLTIHLPKLKRELGKKLKVSLD